MLTLENKQRVETKYAKRRLRELFFKEHRDYFSDHTRAVANRCIKMRLKDFFKQKYNGSKTFKVMVYLPFPLEVPVWKMLEKEKHLVLYYPVKYGTRLEARRHAHDRSVPLWKMDYIITPGLFVNRAGYRLGRGGGFYDRALRFIPRRKTLFVGYNFQTERSELIVEAHDIPVGCVLNERYWRNCYR